VLKLPRYTGFEISGSPNHTIEQESHGELHRRFDGLNGMALAGTPRSQKKVVGASITEPWFWGAHGLSGLGFTVVIRERSGREKKKQRKGTTTNNYQSVPFLSTFNPLNNTLKRFLSLSLFHSFGYTFLNFSFSSFSKTLLNLKSCDQTSS